MSDRTGIRHTCPTIDKALACLNEIDRAMDEVRKAVKDAEDLMEEVRDANSALREVANDALGDCDTLRDEVRALEARVPVEAP